MFGVKEFSSFPDADLIARFDAVTEMLALQTIS